MSDPNEWDFTYTWRIESFTRWNPKEDLPIRSPYFTFEAFGNCRWNLEILGWNGFLEYEEEYLSCHLTPHDAYNISASDKIQIMIGNEKILRICTKEVKFETGFGFVYRDFITQRDLLEKMKNCRSDTLIVQCSVRGRDGGAMQLAKKGEGWTRFSEDRSCIEWCLKSFENLHSVIGRKFFYLGDMLYEMEAKTHQEVDEINIRRLWKTSSEVEFNGKMIFLDVRGHKIFSLGGRAQFDSNDGPDFYYTFIIELGLNKIVKERLNEIMEGGEIFLRFEFHLKKETIIGSKAETNKCISIESILNMTDDFRNLLSSESHSDVDLKVDNKVLKAHRLVLAARSPVFSAMFDNDMLENRTGTVDILDMDEDTLENFVKFLYTGKLDDWNCEIASKLLLAADKYQVSSLEKECCRFLTSNVCVENVCSVLVLAEMVQHVNLKENCMCVIVTHLADIFMSPGWLKIVNENPKLTSEVTSYIGQYFAKTSLVNQHK